MPVPIKIVISIAALVLTITLFLVDHNAADPRLSGAAKWITLALGPLMVGSIWVFPEAKKGDVSDIRKANAKCPQDVS